MLGNVEILSGEFFFVLIDQEFHDGQLRQYAGFVIRGARGSTAQQVYFVMQWQRRYRVRCYLLARYRVDKPKNRSRCDLPQIFKIFRKILLPDFIVRSAFIKKSC